MLTSNGSRDCQTEPNPTGLLVARCFQSKKWSKDLFSHVVRDAGSAIVNHYVDRARGLKNENPGLSCYWVRTLEKLSINASENIAFYINKLRCSNRNFYSKCELVF